MLIGVLALQGDSREHLQLLARLGVEAIPVKSESELDQVDALIIPGGESTTISKLLVNFGLMQQVRGFAQAKPVLGTCAGLIIISDTVFGALPDQELIGGLPVQTERNAYGGQLNSFEGDVLFADGTSENAAFIRAPKIIDVGECDVLATLNNEPVAVQFKNLIGASFHPELTGATHLHKLFVSFVQAQQS